MNTLNDLISRFYVLLKLFRQMAIPTRLFVGHILVYLKYNMLHLYDIMLLLCSVSNCCKIIILHAEKFKFDSVKLPTAGVPINYIIDL